MATPASGTYQQSGPSSPQAARAVLAELPNQQKSFGDLPAYHTTNNGPNKDLRIQARASGAGGEAITVAFVAAGDNTAFSISTTANAITVNLATDAAGNPASTAHDVVAALNTDPNASPLVAAAVVNGDGSGYVSAFTSVALSGDLSASFGTDGSDAPLPKQHPLSNTYA